MKFCCASNAAIKKMPKLQEKNQLFSQNIFNKIAILLKQYRYFQILEVLPVILTTYLPV